ncbi:hypothetical protein C0Q70_07361 [Pomacea canaliculata]|uniref:C-type lectin domain-containing protein n=1 Tax=Pomacea canaliculata TaxID=400727 RepID=A0A2T7PEU4_POMCA|nr:hypothetical protein C0Q70_07361 [Pomacea canaliculata]
MLLTHYSNHNSLLFLSQDPAGRTLSSDGFNDEYFYLDVPADTADSGDYCCQLDCRAPDFCCLDDQSPLRSCATIPVHTDRMVEVTTDDKMSLGNLTQAMAYLVQRQARCDQLDTYITKVETLQVDMLKGIENMRNTTTDARVQLETETNHKLWNFQLQMDSNASKVMESCNVSQQQLLTTVSDKLLQLEMKLNKDLVDLNNASFTADRRLEANINKSVEHLQKVHLQLDTNISKAVESFNELNERLMETSKELQLNQTNFSYQVENIVTRLDKDGGIELKLTKASDQVKDLQKRTEEISEATDKHQSQLEKQITELAAEGKTGLSGECLLKTGYVWYQRTCLKLSTRQVDYVTAKVNCEADGAHLYDIKSPVLDEERVRFAIKQSGLSRDIDIWLGGNDLEIEGDYRWSDGTPLSSSFKLWETGQPSDSDEKRYPNLTGDAGDSSYTRAGTASVMISNLNERVSDMERMRVMDVPVKKASMYTYHYSNPQFTPSFHRIPQSNISSDGLRMSTLPDVPADTADSGADYAVQLELCRAQSFPVSDDQSPRVVRHNTCPHRPERLSRDIDIWVGGNDLEFEGDYRWSDGTPLSYSSKLWETGQPSDIDKTINIIFTYKHPHQQKAVTNTDVTIVLHTLYVAKSSSYGRGRCF